jgi:hypothetical protein
MPLYGFLFRAIRCCISFIQKETFSFSLYTGLFISAAILPGVRTVLYTQGVATLAAMLPPAFPGAALARLAVTARLNRKPSFTDRKIKA